MVMRLMVMRTMVMAAAMMITITTMMRALVMTGTVMMMTVTMAVRTTMMRALVMTGTVMTMAVTVAVRTTIMMRALVMTGTVMLMLMMTDNCTCRYSRFRALAREFQKFCYATHSVRQVQMHQTPAPCSECFSHSLHGQLFTPGQDQSQELRQNGGCGGSSGGGGSRSGDRIVAFHLVFAQGHGCTATADFACVAEAPAPTWVGVYRGFGG